MILKRLLPIALIFSGCSLIPSEPLPDVKPVEVITVEKPPPMYHPPLPNQISTLPVEWRVLTPATMQDYLTDREEGKAPENAFYGLSVKGYENLSANMSEIKRWMRQAISIINYYRDYDDDVEGNVETP